MTLKNSQLATLLLIMKPNYSESDIFNLQIYGTSKQQFKHIRCLGEISLKQALDREKHSMYNFTIVATDNGGKMGFAKVTVKVQDENDNVPQFLMKEYGANVASNASIGTSVVRVSISIVSITCSHDEYTVFC